MSPPPVGAVTGASVGIDTVPEAGAAPVTEARANTGTEAGADAVTEGAVDNFPAPLWYEVRGGEREEVATVAQALRALAPRFTGWCLWYGKATERWWALSPTWCRERVGLVEADNPAELAARMRHIEGFRPQLTPDQHERPQRPLSGTDHPMTVAVSRHEDHGGGSDKGTTSTELTHEGGDRDGDAPAVRTRRRTR